MIIFIKTTLSRPRLICSFIIAISLLSLASALIAEHLFGLKPCILCIYQRIPFVLNTILGLTGLLILTKTKNEKLTAFILCLCGVIFFAGSIIALYHTGVELHWWTSFLEACAADFDAAMLSPEEFLKQIEAARPVRCDEIPWADPILGLSMANYNAAMSFGLGGLTLISALLITRKANGL